MEEVEIPKVDLDYLPSVALRILEQLSFGFNDSSIWNVPGAPSLEQMREFWEEHKEEFTGRQAENIESYLIFS